MKFCAPNSIARHFFKWYLILSTLLVAAGIKAQGTSASVTGFVTDASNAKLASAMVTFTNTATGVTGTATTNSAGLYRITGLLPGNYTAKATMQGFKTAARPGIDLRLEDQVSLDFTLDVGSVSESVTVDAGAALLETQSPTVSQVIEGRQVEETPLNGRNVMNLVTLTAGVVGQGATSGAAINNTNGGAFTNTLGLGNYEIAGGLANQNSVYVDGGPINFTQGHAVPFAVTQDAIQEFRVETSVVSPQYGEFGGGIISFATRSGTGQVHGTLYEYLRNTDLNANNFFNNETHQPRPEFIQNQYGATIGGPVPHSKVFYFASYEGFRLALGVPNVGRVPTPAELSGDFTADAPIFDPLTPKHQIYCIVNGVMTPNRICQPGQVGSGSTIDPTSNVVGNVVKYFPTPNTTTAGPAINFSQNGEAFSTFSQYNFRGDGSLGSKQKLFARYTLLKRNQRGTKFLNNPIGPTSGSAGIVTTQQAVVGDTIILDATSVVDLRASYVRYYSVSLPVATNVNLAEFGPNWAAIAPQVSYQVFPDVSITNNIPEPFALLDISGPSPYNNYILSGTYSKTLGRHSLSFGGEARQREEYFNPDQFPLGNFVFAGSATACASGCISATGTSIASTAAGSGATPDADFVIGTITSAAVTFTQVAFPSAVNHYGGIFANDQFQLARRLTITAGLRYELPGGFTEKHDRNTVLLPQLANPLVLVNSSAYPSRSDVNSHLTLFSPRVGLAFEPYTGTSFRAGYSLAYLPVDTVVTAAPAGSPVNGATTFVTAGSKLSNPLPGGNVILQPIGRGYATNPAKFLGQTIQSRVPNARFPYLQQWNATVQQSVSNSAVFQFAYLGARGDHMPVYNSIDLNQLPDQYDGLPAATITAMAGPNPTVPGGILRPYPMYQNVNQTAPLVGDTYYHSLQVTFNKRFSSGGTLLGNYSWSKFLGNAESTNAGIESHPQGLIQDYNNLRGEKSYLSFDLPQRLVVSYIVDLPVGKGKRFLANSNGLVEQIVSGWNASGINTFQSGYPEAITATANLLSTSYGAGTIRPNVVAGCTKAIHGPIVSRVQAGQPFINSACFTAPAATSFGNEPRTDGSIRDQGVDNWDFSIGKTTPIHENVALVFRAEAFNVINRVQFGDPNLSSASALFGIVTTQVNSPRLLQFSLRLNY